METDMGKERCLFVQGFKGNSHAGSDHPAKVLPLSRNEIHRNGGTEVGDNGGGTVLNQCRIGIDKPILSDLFWIPVSVFDGTENRLTHGLKGEAKGAGRLFKKAVQMGDYRAENDSFNSFSLT